MALCALKLHSLGEVALSSRLLKRMASRRTHDTVLRACSVRHAHSVVFPGRRCVGEDPKSRLKLHSLGEVALSSRLLKQVASRRTHDKVLSACSVRHARSVVFPGRRCVGEDPKSRLKLHSLGEVALSSRLLKQVASRRTHDKGFAPAQLLALFLRERPGRGCDE